MSKKPETQVQAEIRLNAASSDNFLWRNNSGAHQDEYGNHVRYGLCNDSARLNKNIKSSDLIGFTRVFITPSMVGHRLAIFTAPEVKAEAWKHGKKLNEHETAQKRFCDIVTENGGIAGFCNSVADYQAMIYRFHEKFSG